MLEFKEITLADRSWIEPLLAMGNNRGSEYTFSNNYIYRKIYHIQAARMQDYYIVRSGKDEKETSYLFPAGSGDIKPVLLAMMDDAALRGQPFRVHGVTKEQLAVVESLFPGRFQAQEVRDNFDYLYESSALITLSGKKLHSKRNFINRFQTEQEGRWRYEPITAENLEDCWQMNLKWCEQMGCGEDPSLMDEMCAVRNCFENFQALGLLGGALYVADKVVAYTMGRPLCADTFIVHVEKAFPQVTGAYPTINQQFVSHNCADFRYINREDDVGDEGLRKAKLSYHPAILLEKYALTMK